MDWLSKYKVLIDCAKKSVKMTTPEGKEMKFITEPVVTAKGVANCVKANQLDASQGLKVTVVNEFSDVFPEELPGMPPDRDIEFVIELKPDTTPIYKTPYRMAPSCTSQRHDRIFSLMYVCVHAFKLPHTLHIGQPFSRFSCISNTHSNLGFGILLLHRLILLAFWMVILRVVGLTEKVLLEHVRNQVVSLLV
jgi:hypothetical protein